MVDTRVKDLILIRTPGSHDTLRDIAETDPHVRRKFRYQGRRIRPTGELVETTQGLAEVWIHEDDR